MSSGRLQYFGSGGELAHTTKYMIMRKSSQSCGPTRGPRVRCTCYILVLIYLNCPLENTIYFMSLFLKIVTHLNILVGVGLYFSNYPCAAPPYRAGGHYPPTLQTCRGSEWRPKRRISKYIVYILYTRHKKCTLHVHLMMHFTFWQTIL